MRILEESSPGSVLAIVRSGVRVLEYDAVGPEQRLQDFSRRGLALELYDYRKVNLHKLLEVLIEDTLRSREIGEMLAESGLARKEVGEKIFVGEEPHQYYIKYVKEGNVARMRGSQEEDRDKCQPLVQYHPQASLTSRLDDGSNPLRADTSLGHKDQNINKQDDEASENRRKAEADITSDKNRTKFDQIMEKLRISGIEEEADKNRRKERKELE